MVVIIVIDEMFDKYYNVLYTEGATVRCVNNTGRKSKTKSFKYHHNNVFKNWLINYSSFDNIDTYIEKYPDESAVDKIILDYDCKEDKGAVGKYIMEVSNYLKSLGVSHFIEDSTNKGYHLIIFLGKSYDFTLNKRFKYNNKMFKSFVYRLLWKYTVYLDDVNVGLKTNIRMLGSRHPKTGKCVSPVLMRNYDYSSHDFIDDCYQWAMDSVPEIKYHGCWKKVVDYKGGYIDLRTLPWDGKFNDNGTSFWTRCPFHDDNKPSLRVYEKSVYCMKCQMITFSEICDYFSINVGGDNKC